MPLPLRRRVVRVSCLASRAPVSGTRRVTALKPAWRELGHDMTLLDNLIAWCKEQQAQFQRQIEMLESGELQTHERRPGSGLVDTTEADLARAKRQLAEIDELLARYSELAEVDRQARPRGH